MIKALNLIRLAERFGGSVVNGDASVHGVSTNTKAINSGDVFVALKGERFDAHNFVGEAQSQGAIALVVEKHITTSDCPQWIVNDTTVALGNIAKAQRDNFLGKLVAITGSSGKTTVKGMLESILRVAADDKVFATKGNLNNHIGVPLSLLSLQSHHQYAVIEMGASAMGEIDYLTAMASPDVAMINNVMAAHVEGFGSIDNIAKAKGEIYNGLSDNGIAVINAADKYAPQWLAKNKHRTTITFSADEVVSANINAHQIQQQNNGCAQFTLRLFDISVPVHLSVLGLHNVANALAAATCAYALTISADVIAKGLHAFAGVAGRLQCISGVNGATIIDDSYNANPNAFCAAIDVLSDMTAKTILIMGDMAELGQESEQEHSKIGEYANSKHVDVFLSIGRLSANASAAFMGDKQHFNGIEELISAAVNYADKNTVLLVKGSRSSRMDRVVKALIQKEVHDVSLVS